MFVTLYNIERGSRAKIDPSVGLAARVQWSGKSRMSKTKGLRHVGSLEIGGNWQLYRL